MTASIILTDLSTMNIDKVDIENIENKHDFAYIDNDGNKCRVMVYEDGLCLQKLAKEYELKLNLRKDSFIEITSGEGVIKLDTKVVDFNENNDILVMRYVIDEEEREIRIIYRS